MAERPGPTSGASERRREFAGLVLDLRGRVIWLDGNRVDLTKIEFDLLAELTRLPGIVRAPSDLFGAVWHTEWMGDEHLLEVTISRLRSKLGERAAEPRFIWTVRAVGYRFEAGPVEPAFGGPAMAAQDEAPTPQPASFLVDTARRIEWVGGELRELLGWEPEQLIGMQIDDLLHSDDLPRFPHPSSSFEQGQSVTGMFQMRRADEGYACLRLEVRPLMQDGVPVQLYIRSEAAAEEILLHFDDGLVLRDVNPRAPFLGWQPDAIIGTAFMLAAEPAEGLDARHLLPWMRSLAATGPLQSTRTLLVRRADGDNQLATVSTEILVDERGDFAGLLGRLLLDGSGSQRPQRAHQ